MKNNKEKERIESFSSQFDGDEKLASKGKLLITSSLILFALEVTGTTIKEANTFLFKIDFTNQHGVTYLLISAILYLSIRYFNYAQPYHHELFLLWSSRMMSDGEIFSYNPNDDCVHGFLSDAINVWGGDEPGIRDVRYVKSGIFSRGLIYPIHHKDEGVEDSYDEYINLCVFSEKWTRFKIY